MTAPEPAPLVERLRSIANLVEFAANPKNGETEVVASEMAALLREAAEALGPKQGNPVHAKLQIIHKNHKPYGIRDESGYLFFFADVSKYPAQEERYVREIQEQFALADALLAALKSRIE